MRGSLASPAYKPQFSGHETFPLKYGWLKKAFDAVGAAPKDKSVFSGDEAIARFGVGKNMVTSMRYWAVSSGIVQPAKSGSGHEHTRLGKQIFGVGGLDPYMEDLATSWLVHWFLCGRDERTTWYWTFGYLPSLTFERDHLVQALMKLASDKKWSRVAAATVKRDVECFVRTYASRMRSAGVSHEESLESPLVELGLIRPTGKKDGFRMVRGPKLSLGEGVFTYALLDFWRQHSPEANTLSFEAVAHEPGSPGRVFLLEEDDLVERLADIESVTDGAYSWSETAGLKQVIRNHQLSERKKEKLIRLDYSEALEVES
jgi:hypothetical protein